MPVGKTPLRVAADSDRLWVSVFGSGHVVEVDPATTSVASVDVGGPGVVWLARTTSNEVLADEQTMAVRGRGQRRLPSTQVRKGPFLV